MILAFSLILLTIIFLHLPEVEGGKLLGQMIIYAGIMAVAILSLEFHRSPNKSITWSRE